MPFLSGKLKDTRDLDLITEECVARYSHITKGHHEWISNIKESAFLQALENVRSSPDIFASIHTKFPNSNVYPVIECDEIYWAVSPSDAKGSNRVLVDCHYDAPFSWVPSGGVTFYRVLVAMNENTTITTVFPTENASTKMTTGDYHGLNCNTDWHCAKGVIPPGKYRILLKLHYLVVPKTAENSGWPEFVRWINTLWKFFSRETLRMSADPTNIVEWFVAFVANAARILFNNYIVVIILLLSVVGYYGSTQLFVTNRRRRI